MNIHDILKSKDFKEHYDRVIAWNGISKSGKHIFTPEVIEFQYGLVREEYKELTDALEIDDKVEALDAVCDLFVVAAYWDYLVSNTRDYPNVLVAWELLNPLQHTNFDIELHYHVMTTRSPFFVLQTVMGILYLFQGDHIKALQEVLRSNETKFPTKEELSVYFEVNKKNLEIECKRIEEASEGRYTGVTYKKVKNKYIFTTDLGKIVKPITFTAPNLKPYI